MATKKPPTNLSIYLSIYARIGKLTRPFRKAVKRLYASYVMYHCPRLYAQFLFKKELGKRIDWVNPKDINEKINWLAFKTDTSEWSRLADKYAVREFVIERGCSELLIPLVGHWESVNDIDWDKLPNSFVIKTNHGSGDVIIIPNKANVNKEHVLEALDKAIKKTYGIETAEPHYRRIKPCIIAEKLLMSEDEIVSNKRTIELVDYKFWCFNGKPYCIYVCFNREYETLQAQYAIYDLQWKKRENCFAADFSNSINVPKPRCLEKMIDYAEILSKGFPEVRVDLYEYNNKVYFGEMTFTTHAGRMEKYTKDFLLELGEQVVLSKC